MFQAEKVIQNHCINVRKGQEEEYSLSNGPNNTIDYEMMHCQGFTSATL